MVVACHAALTKAHLSGGCQPSAQQMEKALDGNLCRCTGYRPILDACKVTVPLAMQEGSFTVFDFSGRSGIRISSGMLHRLGWLRALQLMPQLNHRIFEMGR